MARTDQLINIYYGRTGGGRGTRPSGGLEKIRRIRGYEGGGGGGGGKENQFIFAVRARGGY